ncbi:MAG TPA: hypothetical protein VFF51_06640 [Candidatus Methylomirabilis sp.]|nr:hypothetical protein [Candidatus Methylomirabilis sp.]
MTIFGQHVSDARFRHDDEGGEVSKRDQWFIRIPDSKIPRPMKAIGGDTLEVHGTRLNGCKDRLGERLRREKWGSAEQEGHHFVEHVV